MNNHDLKHKVYVRKRKGAPFWWMVECSLCGQIRCTYTWTLAIQGAVNHVEGRRVFTNSLPGWYACFRSHQVNWS